MCFFLGVAYIVSNLLVLYSSLLLLLRPLKTQLMGQTLRRCFCSPPKEQGSGVRFEMLWFSETRLLKFPHLVHVLAYGLVYGLVNGLVNGLV